MPATRPMIGYHLSSEEHGPRQLVAFARRAEAAGFDYLQISDHFHPWALTQGQSPFVWGVLGALAEATQRVPILTAVTCPTIRIHPAIVAHAAATAAVQLRGASCSGSDRASDSTRPCSETGGRRPRCAWRCWGRPSR